MLKKLKKLWRGEEGFTLVELMVVVIILGILAAVAVPMYLKNAETAKENAALTSVGNIKSAIDVYIAQNGTYPTVGQAGGTGDISTVLQDAGINWTDTSTGPILDPWTHPFVYYTDGKSYEIFAGPDTSSNYYEASNTSAAAKVIGTPATPAGTAEASNGTVPSPAF